MFVSNYGGSSFLAHTLDKDTGEITFDFIQGQML
jgi:hypothetical protein